MNETKKHGRRWGNASGGASQKEVADNILKDFVGMMVEKVKAVKGDWTKPWFSPGVQGSPRALFGDEYRGMNALMTMFRCEAEGWDVPLFATFNRFNELNYSGKVDERGRKIPLTGPDGNPLPYVGVRAGEKGTKVTYNKPYAYDFSTRKTLDIKDYDRLSDEEKAKYSVLTKPFSFTVFNICQTNIREQRPELWEKLCKDYLAKDLQLVKDDENQIHFEPTDRMVRENKWIVPVRFENQDNCRYSKSAHDILMPLREQFIAKGDDGRNFYISMWHEMVHSALHEDKAHGGVSDVLTQVTGITEEESGTRNSKAFDRYSCEELAAELGGAFIAHRYGITSQPTEDSLRYLDSWLKNLQESPEFLKTAMRQMKGATLVIAEHIDKMDQVIRQERDAGRGMEPVKEDVGMDFDGDGLLEGTESDRIVRGDGRDSSQESSSYDQAARNVFHRR